ncbi:MAG: hypothetical protein ACFWUM_06255 [Eubacteriales bacterium]|jgi:hypothetical protein
MEVWDTAVTASGNYVSVFTPEGENKDKYEFSINVPLTVIGIKTAPTASTIPYGSKLSESGFSDNEVILDNGEEISGTFTWKDGNAIATASGYYIAIFTPTDTTYEPFSISVHVTVTQLTPVVTTLPTASSIPYGSKLSASVLSGGVVECNSETVDGTFTWKNGDVAVTASGEYEAVFTPADKAKYETVSINVPVAVTAKQKSRHSKAKPVMPTILTDVTTNIIVDISDLTLPAGVTAVSLNVVKGPENAPDQQAANFSRALLADPKAGVIGSPVIYNMELLDQNGNVITFMGKIKITFPVPRLAGNTPCAVL